MGSLRILKQPAKEKAAPKPAKPAPKAPKAAKAPKPAKAPTPKPTPKQVSEIEKRTGKSRAEINKMKPADVVKFLPAELRENIASKMKPPKKKFDVDEIEEKLRKKIDDVYTDLIERFIDGRGSETAQLNRASMRAGKYVIRRIKQYAKEEKIKTTEDFIKKINENRSNFRDWLEF